MIIGVDVDGVLIDIHTPWLRKYNRIASDDLCVSDITTWRVANHVKPAYQGTIHLMRSPDLYYKAMPIAWSQVATLYLDYIGFILVAVTHDDLCHTPAKAYCLRKHFPWIKEMVVTSNNKRSSVKFDYLIDDAPHNNPDILFDQPWNRDHVGITRANSWLSVIAMLRGLL